MKKSILFGLIGAMTLGVNAGDWGKAPVGKSPISAPAEDQGSVELGFMSHYIFRGMVGAVNTYYADVNYTFENLTVVPITIGAARYTGGDGKWSDMFGAYDGGTRMVLSAEAALGTFAGFDTVLGLSHYSHEDYGNYAQPFMDVSLELTRSLGFADLRLLTVYGLAGSYQDERPEGLYTELALSRSFGITDALAVIVEGGLAYDSGYNWAYDSGGSDFNHYFFKATLPIELKSNVTFSPYVGFNGSPTGWSTDGAWNNGSTNDQSDIFHAGASVEITF